MHFIYCFLFLLAGIKWGDWKNWRDYYPTILFLIGGDLLKNALLHNHRMWAFQEVFFGQKILIGHFAIDLMVMTIIYPVTILIYLGHYPRVWWKQIIWVAIWVFLFSAKEFINLNYLNLINHYHGWNMGWSILFNIAMFVILRIHFKNPPYAWTVSIIWIVFLFNWFNIPIDVFK
ncbi:CBO0543 family protein [Neobacillus sp. PS3-40]|uniref:CBO0543 family protein n=1 Tax=Neobacillus sp. PS3-40 TaxID=3070679 RepID=UPI0027E0FCFF|nr:CBO0543 family protein [Neobacillus sp. PS3-40]WML44207.1 CBO0543 family protein [Neobacillus sp. PS3-40]